MKNNDQNSGWVNFYKPRGMTSAQAVYKVRKELGIRKVGHAGTLDPLAEGVLPIAYGKATKEIQKLMDADKDYEFTISFGIQMDTDDLEGKPEKESNRRPTLEQLEKILPAFTGDILQTPSKFSAIKINGIPAYKLAREGKEFTMPQREVTIHSLKIKEFSQDKATLVATVSKGTYIRSLARDIGQKLACYAHVIKLMRTRVGNFTLSSAKRES